jgi:hypothetical protein
MRPLQYAGTRPRTRGRWGSRANQDRSQTSCLGVSDLSTLRTSACARRSRGPRPRRFRREFTSACRSGVGCAHQLCDIGRLHRSMLSALRMTRQGLRTLRPTRPAGPTLHLAEPSDDGSTQDNDLDFAPWHAPQEKRLQILARQGTRRTEADIVVTVRRHIPVTVGGADVHSLIVERAATQHTATRSQPSGS